MKTMDPPCVLRARTSPQQWAFRYSSFHCLCSPTFLPIASTRLCRTPSLDHRSSALHFSKMRLPNSGRLILILSLSTYWVCFLTRKFSGHPILEKSTKDYESSGPSKW